MIGGSMRTILFDLLNAQPSKTSKFHGGGEYIKIVFSTLVERCGEVQVVPFYDSERFLDEWIKILIEDKQLKTFDVKSTDQIKMVAYKIVPDVFFSGLPEHYKREWFPKCTEIIGVIHGLRKIEIIHDEYEWKYFDGKQQIKSKLRLLKAKVFNNREKERNCAIVDQKRVIELLDLIICDSYHTYYALDYYYNDIALKKLKMFYPPLKKTFSGLTNTVPAQVKGKFLLLLGGDRWLKNAYRGIKAIDDLYVRGFLEEIQTVLVGQTSQTIRNSVKNIDKFIWLDYVESDELEALYQNCEVFIYPSLNEGFGYPPLEAMRYGKTCVVSAVCSLPEICGNAVYYINPYDIGEIADRILCAIDMPIEGSVISDQMNGISAKQNEDLYALCDYIIKN